MKIFQSLLYEDKKNIFSVLVVHYDKKILKSDIFNLGFGKENKEFCYQKIGTKTF